MNCFRPPDELFSSMARSVLPFVIRLSARPAAQSLSPPGPRRASERAPARNEISEWGSLPSPPFFFRDSRFFIIFGDYLSIPGLFKKYEYHGPPNPKIFPHDDAFVLTGSFFPLRAQR